MGLDTSHDCWHGPYGQFMRWRVWLAKQIGIPLGLMETFYGWQWNGDEVGLDQWPALYELAGKNNCYSDTLKAMQSLGRGISWDTVRSPLKPLLNHSDCDGRIRWWDCKAITLGLLTVIRSVPDDTKYPTYEGGPRKGELIWCDWRAGRGVYDGCVPACKRFAVGAWKAFKAKEDVTFR